MKSGFEKREGSQIPSGMPLPKPKATPRRLAPMSKLRLALLLVALLAVIGLTVDLVTLRLRAQRALKEDGITSVVSDVLIDITTATQRWTSADGRLSMILSPGWNVAEDGPDTYDVTLRGPYRMELNVAVRDANPGGMEALREELLKIEESLHLTTSLQADTFQGHPAWRRTMPLQKSTVEALDWIDQGLAVHVLMAAPAETFPDFRPVLVELRESLRVQADISEGVEGNP